MRRAVFLSDVHLSAADPATAELLSRFLERVVTLAPDALFILGDLFEYWAGDDDLGDPFNARIARELRAVHESGIALYFLAGNRDFLIGQEFARAAGLTILADPTRLEVGRRALLISHGDVLCTDDLAYQNFRRMVREPAWQSAFLARALADRHALIGDMRSASESAKRAKAMDIMDVNRSAVERMIIDGAHAILIHGHTHRPVHESLTISGAAAERWVLPDWDALEQPPRGGGLLVEEGGFTVLAAQTAPSPT